MNNPFIGSLFGNSISWTTDSQVVVIRLGFFEALGLPILVMMFSMFFAVKSYAAESSAIYFFLVPFLVSIWMFFRGRRRIVLVPENSEVELRMGQSIRKKISTSSTSFSLQKTRVWDSQTDGPSYFWTYVLAIGNQPLLSSRNVSRINELAEEIRKVGFAVTDHPNPVRANL